MGGHGALYLAFRHPDVFGNAGSMSGGVDIRPFPGNWNLNNALGTMEAHPERWEAAAVVNLVKNIRPGQVNIYFDCGVDDFFAGVNDNLHRVLLEAGIPHDYVSRPGAHTWEYWNNSILHHLLFFSEAFNR
jgi:S-formylglutathione hydrolase FrmB